MRKFVRLIETWTCPRSASCPAAPCVASRRQVADAFADPLGHREVPGPEVHVVGDQGGSGADRDHAGSRVRRFRTEVRLPLRLAHLGGEPFELPLPDLREVAALLGARRILVEIDRDSVAFRDLRPDLAGERHALLHGRAADRDHRHHVDRAHAGVLPGVTPQVDSRHGRVEERPAPPALRRLDRSRTLGCARSDETSSRRTGAARTAAAISDTNFSSRPSEMLGTHSMTVLIGGIPRAAVYNFTAVSRRHIATDRATRRVPAATL